jgi:hypothetical protein
MAVTREHVQGLVRCICEAFEDGFHVSGETCHGGMAGALFAWIHARFLN